MASVFKNFNLLLTDEFQDVYTCPANTKTIVLHCQAANIDLDNHDLSIYWSDASSVSRNVYLASEIVVPTNAAYEPIGGKLILEEGDKIRAKADSNSFIDISMSVMEMS